MEIDVLLVMELFLLLCLISSSKSHRDVEVVMQSAAVDDHWYFQLLDPEQIRYTYKVKPAKDFGISMNTSYTSIELVLAEPDHACSTITNHLYIKDNIALVERGECSFLSKAINAEEAGATAIVIMDFDKDNDNRMIDMISDDTGRVSNIPAFFLMGKDGYMIAKTLKNLHRDSAIINIPINATGVPAHLLNQPPWSLW